MLWAALLFLPTQPDQATMVLVTRRSPITSPAAKTPPWVISRSMTTPPAAGHVRLQEAIDPTGTPQFGLVAEEVERVNPDLVVRDREGKPYSVRYDQVNAMLLNEFLKEHRKVEELEASDADQWREIKALVTRVKEQAAQIQKVSAAIARNRATSNVVL